MACFPPVTNKYDSESTALLETLFRSKLKMEVKSMQFFTSSTLQPLMIVLGTGLAHFRCNQSSGRYNNDNPGANAQGS